MKIFLLVLLVYCVLSSVPISSAADKTVEIDGVTLSTREAPKGFTQKKRQLTADENANLRMQDESASRLIQRYVPGLKKGVFTAQILDQAYSAWVRDSSISRPEPDEVIQALGVKLGNLALKACKGSWVHVKDNYGEGLAIEFANSSQQIYPIDSVYKRYDRQETEFFESLYKVYLLAGNDKLK